MTGAQIHPSFPFVSHAAEQAEAHLDFVGCRGLSVVPDLGVVSASHDQTLRLWSFAGETLAELAGHTALVYSAAANASTGLIASASEDSSARLWHGDGSCLQSLPHPRESLLTPIRPWENCHHHQSGASQRFQCSDMQDQGCHSTLTLDQQELNW